MSSHEHLAGTFTQDGNVSKFSFGQAAAPEANPLHEPWQATRVAGGTQRFDATGQNTGELSQGFYQAYEGIQAAEQAAANGGSIAQTYQRENGGSVMVDGMRTSVANAVRQGLVRMEDGRPIDVGYRGLDRQPLKASQESAPEVNPLTIGTGDKPAPTPEHFDAEDLSAFDEAIAPLSQPAYNTTLAAATVALMDGASLDAAATRLARESGGEVSEAQAIVQGVYHIHKLTVARAVAQVGVEPAEAEAFFAWTRSKPRQLQEAIGSLMNERSTRHWQAMGREYVAYNTRHHGRGKN